MTLTCVLCKQILVGTEPPPPTGPGGVPLVGQYDREALNYQAAIILFLGHMQERHRDYLAALHAMSQNYMIHLAAKLATSTDTDFEHQRENARRLCYWTLYGQFQAELSPILPAGTTKPAEA